MKLLNKDLKIIIKEELNKVLNEGNFSDYLAGKIAYLIVGHFSVNQAIHVINGEKKSYSPKYQIDMNQELTYAPIKVISTSIDSFIDGMKPKLERTRQEIIDGLEKNKQDAKKFPERRRTLINSDRLSGIIEVEPVYSFGDTYRYRGAAYNRETKNLKISFLWPENFMNFGGNNKKVSMQQMSGLIKSVRTTMTHELVHSSQNLNEPGMLKKFTNMFNPVKGALDNNVSGFSNIDPKVFPKASEFTEKLREIILKEFSGFASQKDLDNLNRGKSKDPLVAKAWLDFRTMYNLLSPEEVEAYARGYHRMNKDKALSDIMVYQTFEKKVRSQMKRLQLRDLSDPLMDSEAVNGLFKEYEKIFGAY